MQSFDSACFSSACSNARTWQHGELALQDREDHRAASVDVSPSTPLSLVIVSTENFASRRALKLPDVAQRSEALGRTVPSWPHLWHIDRMEASFTLPSCLVPFLQLWLRLKKRCPKAGWITSDTWAAIELHRECRHHFFERIRQRKSLLLRLAFWAWSSSTFHQARKAKADLGGNRLESALQARFSAVLQSRQQRRLKQTVVLGCAAKPPPFKRISTMDVSTSLRSFVRYLSKNKAGKGPQDSTG